MILSTPEFVRSAAWPQSNQQSSRENFEKRCTLKLANVEKRVQNFYARIIKGTQRDKSASQIPHKTGFKKQLNAWNSANSIEEKNFSRRTQRRTFSKFQLQIRKKCWQNIKKTQPCLSADSEWNLSLNE